MPAFIHNNQTKIVATLGPASSDLTTIERLIEVGVSVFRLNFSHGTQQEQAQRVDTIKQAAQKCQKSIAILADLQGPKIRIACFKQQQIFLEKGSQFIIDSNLAQNAGTEDKVGIDYPQLIDDCSVGNTLLLDDGMVSMKIVEKQAHQLICEVLDDGVLSDKKGINLLGGGLSAPALTEKDINDVKAIAQMDIDYVAVSFVRDAKDIEQARILLRQQGSQAHIVAKIERAEAIEDSSRLDSIIVASDCIMVARGDLGVEIGNAELVGIQKRLIHRSRELNKVVITATQMMESMISNPVPTRAEVMDVANAVLDGTDAVMLSAETAKGDYPIETVEAVSNIIQGAEKHANLVDQIAMSQVNRVDESIALATIFTANHMNRLKAIICMSSTGNTPLLMSRRYSRHPIYGFSVELKILRRMALYRNIQPLALKSVADNSQLEPFQIAIKLLEQNNVVEYGDKVLVTYGDIAGTVGGTNNMKIITITE